MKSFRIIIADDDMDDFDLLKAVLLEQNSNLVIEHAGNGRELLDILNTNYKTGKGSPDLILLDINMPKINGIQALSILKSKKETSDIWVLIYSTSNSPEQMELCYKLGANGFVTKSHSVKRMTEFANKINSFLQDIHPETALGFFKSLQKSRVLNSSN
ncbi:MAG: response regulator [Bacteroidetes bacterium]|nr:response regulator [Bacteroidota bacterium]